MMRTAITAFARQFAWKPIIERPRHKTYKNVIVAGMGGSALAVDLLKGANASLLLTAHRDYGLPYISPRDRSATLLIASSYSGTTEEALDAFSTAGKRGIARAALAVGGTLEKAARQSGVPFVKIPHTGIQPRCALGFSIKGISALMGLSSVNADLTRLAQTLKPALFETAGKNLARSLMGSIPLIYASTRNEAIASIWKIKFNETGKIPAWCNVMPELNHNEMTGFDHTKKSAKLSAPFHTVILTDSEDDPRIQKRMAILVRLYRQRGRACTIIPLRGNNRWMKIFSSLILADWAAYHTALLFGAEPEQVPMVEEFKRLMARGQNIRNR